MPRLGLALVALLVLAIFFRPTGGEKEANASGDLSWLLKLDPKERKNLGIFLRGAITALESEGEDYPPLRINTSEHHKLREIYERIKNPAGLDEDQRVVITVQLQKLLEMNFMLLLVDDIFRLLKVNQQGRLRCETVSASYYTLERELETMYGKNPPQYLRRLLQFYWSIVEAMDCVKGGGRAAAPQGAEEIARLIWSLHRIIIDLVEGRTEAARVLYDEIEDSMLWPEAWNLPNGPIDRWGQFMESLE